MSFLSKWFRDAQTPDPQTNIFRELLMKQQQAQAHFHSYRRSSLRGPNGETYDPFEKSPLDPNR